MKIQQKLEGTWTLEVVSADGTGNGKEPEKTSHQSAAVDI